MTGLMFSLLCFLAFGGAVGALHFRALAWNVQLLTSGARIPVALGLPVVRIALTTGAFALAVSQGAGQLLVVMLGFLAVRAIVLLRMEGRP